MSLEQRFLGFARSRKLVAEGDHVLVAVSGGIDSIALLHLFHTQAAALGVQVSAAHFDHAMRATSAADADWVAGLCEAWRIPLVRGRAERALVSEQDARNERYRFLYQALQQTGARRAATAHHADDQVETVLMRMLRGAGMRGLSGIPMRRGPFIRPLLRIRKAELLAYARRHGLGHREDETNQQPKYLRNRIRARVVPALEAAQPGARAAVLALARHAARTEAEWRWVLKRLEKDVVVTEENGRIELARDLLLEYHPALRARVLRHFLRRFGIVLGRSGTRHVLQFCDNAASGAALEVPGHVRIERAFDRLRIERARASRNGDAVLQIAGPAGAARFDLNGVAFDVQWTTEPARRADCESFRSQALLEPLQLRGWRAGDRIVLPYGTKKLKKLFAERRIAVSDRARIPVLTDQHNRVLWVAGVARSVHAMVTGPEPVLNLMVKHAELA